MSTAIVPIRATPDYSPATEAALSGIASPHTRRSYDTGIRQFCAWLGGDAITPAAIRAYVDHLAGEGASPATINLRLAAVRRLCVALEESGRLDGSTLARITRLKGRKRHGVRLGLWLTEAQVQAIADKLNDPLDLAILALLYGAGLRREEASEFRAADLTRRDGCWVVRVAHGKGDKERAFGVADWVADALLAVAGEGPVLNLGVSGIYRRVQRFGELIGVEGLAPHDLRRSCGRHMLNAGADLMQIQLMFGHAEEATTRRYLNVQIDLADPAGKRLKLRTKGVNLSVENEIS